jgi:peroxiredoxin
MSAQATTPLAQQIADFKTESAKHLPPDVAAIFNRQAEQLKAAATPLGVASVGMPLPDAQMVDALGEPASIYAMTGERPAVLVFYRGAWCPYCNLALKAYGEQLFPQLSDRGVDLVAISPQKADESLSLKQKHELAFPVLSDPGNAFARRLGVLADARSADVRGAQEKLGLDLPATNADGTEAIPMPTIVIADVARTIRWIDVRPDYTDRTDPSEIIAALDAIL